MLWKVLSHSVVSDSLWPDGARQAPLSMEFSRQEYWSGLPFPSPGDPPCPRDWTWFSHTADRFFTIWATSKFFNSEQENLSSNFPWYFSELKLDTEGEQNLLPQNISLWHRDHLELVIYFLRKRRHRIPS